MFVREPQKKPAMAGGWCRPAAEESQKNFSLITPNIPEHNSASPLKQGFRAWSALDERVI
jgi:hypothetical protein